VRVAGRKGSGGRKKLVNKGEEHKVRTTRNSVKVIDSGVVSS
jgi:hypothetical protein